jgi:hypothetical protein
MGIPEFLLRKLYVRDSFTQYADGFSFALLNSFVLAHMTAVTLEADGQAIPLECVALQSPGQPDRPATSITPDAPYLLPVGAQVTAIVSGVALRPRRLRLYAKTREAGAISLSVAIGERQESHAGETPAPIAQPSLGSSAQPMAFTTRDWERIEHDWKAWWAGELQRPLLFVMGVESADYSEILQNHPLSMLAAKVLSGQSTTLEVARYYGDAFPKWWPNFGPGVMAAFLGAGVEWSPETAWFKPLPAASVSDIHPQYVAANVWWQRVLEFTRAATGTWGSQVTVGHTDLGGALDVLASLRGTQSLLLDLCDAPDKVERVESELTRLWLRYYDDLYAIVEPCGRGSAGWSPCWFPARGYILQSDFSYMISPRMFERFVLPSLTSWCDALDYAFYHLDGPGQVKHLDMLLSIPRLRGIQWVPGEGNPSAQEWLPLLQRIRAAGKLCYVDVTCDGALQIARALGGKGFLFRITEFLEQQEVEDFLAHFPI